jgi:hypothetical protein
MFDSTSIAASCIRMRVVVLLSLRNKENLASNALAKVILADVSEGFISSGILPYIRLNLLVKSGIDSPCFLLKAPNSVM